MKCCAFWLIHRTGQWQLAWGLCHPVSCFPLNQTALPPSQLPKNNNGPEKNTLKQLVRAPGSPQWQRSSNVQQFVNFLEQFVEQEGFCQELEAVQVQFASGAQQR